MTELDKSVLNESLSLVMEQNSVGSEDLLAIAMCEAERRYRELHSVLTRKRDDLNAEYQKKHKDVKNLLLDQHIKQNTDNANVLASELSRFTGLKYTITFSLQGYSEVGAVFAIQLGSQSNSYTLNSKLQPLDAEVAELYKEIDNINVELRQLWDKISAIDTALANPAKLKRTLRAELAIVRLSATGSGRQLVHDLRESVGAIVESV